eukprot:1337792-Amorphochlora_amoeboformis.AAC.2
MDEDSHSHRSAREWNSAIDIPCRFADRGERLTRLLARSGQSSRHACRPPACTDGREGEWTIRKGSSRQPCARTGHAFHPT